jgi:DNA-binding transcriptional ArsR family regulator
MNESSHSHGWVRVYRQMLERGHFNMPAAAFKMWIYFLLRAAHQEQTAWKIEPGEAWISYEDIQRDCADKPGTRLSRRTVAKHLRQLEDGGYIKRIHNCRGLGMKIRIVNWDKYQS